MADVFAKLRGLGLLSENHTFAEIQERARIKSYAWCLTNSCPIYRQTAARHRDVNRDAVDCPACGYALFWRKKKHEVKDAQKICPISRSRENSKKRRRGTIY